MTRVKKGAVGNRRQEADKSKQIDTDDDNYVAAYIADVVEQLALMARASNSDFLARLLSDAKEEANRLSGLPIVGRLWRN